MAKILSGKEVAASLSEGIKTKVDELLTKDIHPMLVLLRVGDNPNDLSYERGIVRRCESLGVSFEKIVLPEDVSQDLLLEVTNDINNNNRIHGCLLFRPLPANLNQSLIENSLVPAKDVDCMTDISLSGIFTGKEIGFPPCTPQACMKILDYYGIDCTGKRAVVVGRSLLAGKSVAMMLLQKNATVTICHTRTRDLPSITREADILIAAAGKAGMIGAEHVRPGQIVIDIGINCNSHGEICGDVDYDAVQPVVDMITPVPGGVGAVTTSMLVSHVVEAAFRQNEKILHPDQHPDQ